MEKSRKFFMAAAIEFVCLVILFVIVYFFLAKETNAVTEKETNIGTVLSFDEDRNKRSENQIQVIKTVLEKDQVIFELEETCLDDTVRYKTTIPVVFYTALLDDNVWEGKEFYVSRKNGETWLTISGRVGPKQNSVRLLDAVQTHEMTYNIRRTKKEDGVYIIETGHNVYAYTPAPEYFIEVWSEKDKMFLILPTPKDAPELYGWEMPQHLACK